MRPRVCSLARPAVACAQVYTFRRRMLSQGASTGGCSSGDKQLDPRSRSSKKLSEALANCPMDVNETLYLCNFRVSVDGDWLCLKELQDSAAAQMAPTNAQKDAQKHQQKQQAKNASPQFEQIIQYPDYPLGKKERDPVLIERSNLVNILKLVVKEVIDSSLKFGRQLDSDHIPLQHFFIVLEHILRHGLRPKKGLLGPKKELWDLLQIVEKNHTEAVDITASVRDLPTVNTNVGRARAWLRLALMQKKLADYFRTLVQRRDDLLSEFYEPQALLCSEEAEIIVGLLLSLNIVDCNICMKEENLDCQQGVIDFSLYLRSKRDVSESADSAASASGSRATNSSAISCIQEDRINTVLNQKNYIEELNRHLTATVASLEAKVESLTATNALMSEDLAIAKAALKKAVPGEKPHRFGIPTADEKGVRKADGGGRSLLSKMDSEAQKRDAQAKANLEQQLKSLQSEKDALAKELKLQMSMKSEMEVAVKLLESSVEEKQETIVSLRDQLEDIKEINMEMYIKLQECESEITAKGELVAKLEAKTQEISRMLTRLDQRRS